MPDIDRRAFLGRGLLLGAGALAWACGGGKKPAATTNPAKALSVAPTAQYLAVGDTRNAFVLLEGQKPVTPDDVAARLRSASGDSVRLRVRKERVRLGIGGEEDHDHPEGTEILEIYVFRHDFEAGPYEIVATAGDRRAAGTFEVLPKDPSPGVGDEAVASQSPTTSDDRGVDPICTRKPVCSLHEITIAEALDRGKPLVINFGTPEFCQSRTCGPVVDIVEEQAKRVGDGASFIHVEVFRNRAVALRPTGDSPTFKEWKLKTEPWTYFIDTDGKVVDRWLGPIGRDELRRAVDDLLG